MILAKAERSGLRIKRIEERREMLQTETIYRDEIMNKA
jgi:hypothetical protein